MERSAWNRIGAADQPQAVILYENSSTRAHAARFWDAFRTRKTAAKAHVSWWPFALLQNPVAASDAADSAAQADLIVFGLHFEGDFPDEIKQWMETWLGKRHEREGALVGLISGQPGPGGMASLKEIHLRHVALRAGMDYLSQTPPTASMAMPDSLDSFCDRAGQMTSVLDEILHAPPPPPSPPRPRV